MAKGKPKNQAGILLATAALVWDLRQAARHQRTCPKCMERDYLSIAFDIAHLAGAT